MISEPSNYYDAQVIAMDLTRLYRKEQELLADMIKKQASATSMAEQKQIMKEYQELDDVVKFSDRKEEILRRQQVAQDRAESAKHQE
jgi:hypothetical protein